jgi:hypothetical protein
VHALRVRFLALVVAVISLSGCYSAAHSSSPWEYGWGLKAAPGYPMGNKGVTVHPAVSFTYLSFDGGHDELYEIGGQIRKPLNTANKLWVGGELMLAKLRTEVDDYDDFSESTNGWSLNALLGMPIGQSRWGVNLFVSAGICNYGSSGKNLRAGIDLQPWFLK